jgi:hypothetical protein
VNNKRGMGCGCISTGKVVSLGGTTVLLLLLSFFTAPAQAREKDALQYGEGLIINIPYPVDEVTQAVRDVAANEIIRGTKEYSKDEYVKGAEEVRSTPAFPAWTDPGEVFYKVRKQALDPWNFKDSSDVGTLAVRYVVQPQGEKNTVLRIDALFVEDNRHSVHPSNGSVESAEFKDIQDHLTSAELLKKETAEALRQKQEYEAKKNFGLGPGKDTELLSTPPRSEESSSREGEPGFGSASAEMDSKSSAGLDETPEEHLASLRRQVERTIKKPGAALKSAPFHSASTIRSLEPGTEVLVVILSPYWLGVETHEGDHGWVRRDQLELLP